MKRRKREKAKKPKLIASDGLRARDNGAWAREKLDFLDLFAGPGINMLRGLTDELEGSPLRALALHADGDVPHGFTHATFVNRSLGDHRALLERVRRRTEAGSSLIPANAIHCVHGDANEELPGLLAGIHPKAYIFVFADITAPKQLPWSTLELLSPAGSHGSIDLYVLFPLDMAVIRLISFNKKATDNCAAVLTTFFGCEEWRALSDRRLTSAQSPELRRGLENLYVGRLRKLWGHAVTVADIRRGPKHRLYKMLFATSNLPAFKLAKWWVDSQSRLDPPGQGEFFQ